MGMDIYSVLLSLVMIVVGYFVIKKLPVIVVAVVGFAMISVLSLFVLRDTLHVPVNDYVDTSEIDVVINQTNTYTKEKLFGNHEEVYVDDVGLSEDGDVDGDVTEKDLELGNVEKYRYDELDDIVIEEIVGKYSEFASDNSFENKVRGMTPYVDISYEFDRLKIYSSDDREYLVFELVK